MKTKKLFLVPALIASLHLISAGQAPAQTFTSLGNRYSASDSQSFLGNTVYASLRQLVLSSNVFYGTWSGDDDSRTSGGVYARNTDGTGSTNLHSFSEIISPGYGPRRNTDGARPYGGVILSGATLYGTTHIGGSGGNGTIFKVSTNGTGFTVLQHGGYSTAGLLLSGDTLYGTGHYGGSSNAGTVFSLNTNGTGFTNLHSFMGNNFTGNSDGAYPAFELVLSGNTLYGTATGGGSSYMGTVFAIRTDGTGFTNLHSFTALSNGTNSDGANPLGGLVLSGNTLYGTAQYGGRTGRGTVFAVKTNGTGFTNLYSFTTTFPFEVAPFYTIYTNRDGAFPRGTLALSGQTLYGTTFEGGGSGGGTIFSLSFEPQLSIVRSGTGVILSWPTNVAGFDSTGYKLQSTPSLVSPAVWSTNSPAPVVMAGRNTITNSISATPQFYRLAQ